MTSVFNHFYSNFTHVHQESQPDGISNNRNDFLETCVFHFEVQVGRRISRNDRTFLQSRVCTDDDDVISSRSVGFPFVYVCSVVGSTVLRRITRITGRRRCKIASSNPVGRNEILMYSNTDLLVRG